MTVIKFIKKIINVVFFQQVEEEGWTIEKMSDNDIMDVSTFIY